MWTKLLTWRLNLIITFEHKYNGVVQFWFELQMDRGTEYFFFFFKDDFLNASIPDLLVKYLNTWTGICEWKNYSLIFTELKKNNDFNNTSPRIIKLPITSCMGMPRLIGLNLCKSNLYICRSVTSNPLSAHLLNLFVFVTCDENNTCEQTIKSDHNSFLYYVILF